MAYNVKPLFFRYYNVKEQPTVVEPLVTTLGLSLRFQQDSDQGDPCKWISRYTRLNIVGKFILIVCDDPP